MNSISNAAENRGTATGRTALTLLFLSPALAYLALWTNGWNTLLFEDGLLQSFPFRVFARSAFVNDFSPQWVPNSACGFSLLAEGQNGLCFPATQLIYRLFPAGAGWLLELFLAQAAAFWLCFLLLRRLRTGRVSSLFGACLYAFCPFAFISQTVPAILWCYALLPGVFLACEHAIEARPHSFVFLASMVSLVLLTGHPVMIIYIGIMTAGYIGVHALTARGRQEASRVRTPRFWAALCASVLAAAVIASPQLLPMLQEYGFSARTAGAASSLDLLQKTLSLQAKWIPFSLFPAPPLWGDPNFWSNMIRFPLYALFLVFAGTIYGAEGPRRGYFLFLLVFSVVMALGPAVGLWKIVHSLPVLRHFRFPFRWLFFLPICVSYLSARGLDHLLGASFPAPRIRFGPLLKTLAAACCAAGGAVMVHYRDRFVALTGSASGLSPFSAGLLWVSALGMALAAVLSVRKKGRRTGAALGVSFTVLFLFASLAFALRDPMIIRDLGKIGWQSDAPVPEPQKFRTSAALEPYDVWTRNSIDRHYRYTPNLTVLDGTLTTGHYFSFFPYWSANISAWCRAALKGDRTKQIYLSLSSSHWLFPPERPGEKTRYTEGSFRGIRSSRNPDAMNRASVVLSPRLFPDESGLVAFLESTDGKFDPHRELAVLSSDAAVWNIRTDAEAASGPAPGAAIVAEKPDRVEIELERAAPAGAFLVLTDSYYPGWKARVDGYETDVLRVNYAFRGIQLPEGARRVVFYFDPLVPDAALLLPTLLLSAFGIAALLHRLSRRHHARASFPRI